MQEAGKRTPSSRWKATCRPQITRTKKIRREAPMKATRILAEKLRRLMNQHGG
jgi:hypothetical protein